MDFSMTLSLDTDAVKRNTLHFFRIPLAFVVGAESMRHSQITSAALGIMLEFFQVSVLSHSLQQLREAENASL